MPCRCGGGGGGGGGGGCRISGEKVLDFSKGLR